MLRDEQDDFIAFRARLQECVAASGSLAAFARNAGLPTNTVRRYLSDSEPTRPKLLAMARAAKVSVVWLATGVGQRSEAAVSLPTLVQDPGITARLQQLVELAGGVEAASIRFGIASDRLASLVAGAEMVTSEVKLICRETKTPPAWLLSGRGLDALDQLSAEKTVPELLARIQEIDEKRDRGFRKLGEVTPPHSKWSDGANIKAIFDLWLRILERMPAAAYRIIEIADSLMSPTLEHGDLAVVRTDVSAEKPGLYLFSKGETEFIARCVSAKDGTSFSFDNRQYDNAYASRLLTPSDETVCIGQVCFSFAIVR